ncbi:MAG: elongation factor P [Planctomycetota bacterium]|nr:MAG: elongation factor P [Planctomycetota bacterium]
MVTISTNQFSNGITLRMDGKLFDMVSFQFVKPGKGGAFVRTRLKNLSTGAVKEVTFDSKDKVEQVMVDKVDMEYLYRDANSFVFMDPETFDQVPVDEHVVAELLPLLKENTTCKFKMVEGEIISVALPDHLIFQVVETTPWVKGSTAQGGNKPATLDSGAVIQVPVYLNQDEYVKVDTRTSSFVERVAAPQ